MLVRHGEIQPGIRNGADSRARAREGNSGAAGSRSRIPAATGAPARACVRRRARGRPFAGIALRGLGGPGAVVGAADKARALVAAYPVLSAILFSVVYTALAALAVPAVWAMNVAAGALFGPWIGLPIAVFSSVTGATITMLAARYAFRGWVEARFPATVARLDHGMANGGARFLFAARLMPLLPFPLVNLAAGLTPMPARTFALVSFAAPAADDFAYVSAGASLAHPPEPGRGAVAGIRRYSRCALAAAPFAARMLFGRWARFRASPATERAQSDRPFSKRDCRGCPSWCIFVFLRRSMLERRRASGISVTKPVTPLLDRIASPADLRALNESELGKLAEELRAETISAVSVTGGHLGAGLGVIELTVALHYIFNTPSDRIVWDVGHQAYPHKILTGRRARIRTLRQGGGLSGFTKRAESEYDVFGAGHSSTSISAGLGMAVARDLAKGANNVVAVIGDGAMSAGMAYEAMNNAGAMGSRLIVILNDNDMSIAPPTGAMSAYLARLVTSHTYRSLRDAAKQLARRLPKFFYDKAKRTEEYGRGFFTGGTLFEELGFYYVGPIDGHNLDHLLPILKNVRDMHGGPVLVHVVTKKGKGYPPAEAADDKYHGVSAFDVITGAQAKPKSNAPAYTRVFGEALLEAARRDEKIVAVTAAMPQGTGVDRMQEVFPERVFDVGIAEQHAVTFSAGLATEGFKPFCAIYSTFLQRGYDQVVHDVAIQNLPVRFAIDRAGLVGADGPTHAGAFDIAYLSCLPNMTVMAAADEAELMHMVATAAAHDAGPIALRYPRGDGVGVELPSRGQALPIGKGRIVREGSRIAILSLGTRLAEALKAAEELQARGLSTTVADARFAKPLDAELILRLAADHELLITIEEGAAGGFGAHVLTLLSDAGALDNGLKVRTMTLPDVYQNHDKPERMYAAAGLDAKGIVAKAFAALGKLDLKTSSLIA